MRNNETFSALPDLDAPRSRFERPSILHTTFSSGSLVPIFLDEVLPGDSFDMSTVSNIRMTTPIVPVMDSCYADTFFFYVPSRLCWNRWKEFCGENPRSNWTAKGNDELMLPHILLNSHHLAAENEVFSNKRYEGSLLDYFGLPFMEFSEDSYDPAVHDPYLRVSCNMLPFEAYNLIWNEYFRDENICDPALLLLQNTSADDPQAVFGYYYDTGVDFSAEGGPWFGSRSDYLRVKPVCKFHDYFTSALPQPQRHAPIVLPGFDEFSRHVDVISTADPERFHASKAAMRFGTIDNKNPLTLNTDFGLRNGAASYHAQSSDFSNAAYISPINLIGSYNGNLPNINDLRNAFALQRLFERDGLGGSRYIESLRVHFGVTSPDARLQRPEYLGGSRIDIAMNQVVQTSSTDDISPQGNVSGLSHTFNVDSSFFKSFTEHGYIIGLCCVRPIHSYQNGINKMLLRKRRFDFYYPSLAYIGEQAISTAEINLSQYYPYDGEPQVFGYQEAWADYRYKPNMITGKMRSDVEGSLDVWHYGDDFSNDTVALTPSFIFESGKTIQRSLAVQDEPQFFGDFYFDLKCTRELPLYSVPGLVDHY